MATARGTHSKALALACGAAALWMAGAASSCTLIADPDVTQCARDQDCERFGSGLVCSQHVCAMAEHEAGPADAGLSDAANDAGIEPDGGALPCASGSDCPGGAPHICRAQRCVQLTSSDCPEVVPASAVRDDALFVGFMAPLRGEFASLGQPIEQGAELALEEIESYAKGLPLGTSGARRKLAMVVCHDLDDPLRAARHLIDDLEVPAIVGPAFSGVVLDVATEAAIPSGTLLLSASATSPALTDLADDGLVWRTAPSDAIQAVPLATLVERDEARVRLEQGLDALEPIRVAVVAKGEAYGQGLFEALLAGLRFNGKTAAENGGNFLPITYADPAAGPVDYAPHVSSIVDFAPHVLVLLGTSEIVSELIEPVEAAWAGGPGPYYLVPDGGHDPRILTATEGNASLRTRVRGTVPGQKGEAFADFALRFRARFDAEPGSFADSSYDAAYLLAYAIVHAAAEEPTGAQIALGLGQLSLGAKVLAGPGGLNAGIASLRAGTAIDFAGAAGSHDFDPSTGEAPADIDIWCVTETAGSARFQSSGEYYDAQLAALAGDNVNCDF